MKLASSLNDNFPALTKSASVFTDSSSLYKRRSQLSTLPPSFVFVLRLPSLANRKAGVSWFARINANDWVSREYWGALKWGGYAGRLLQCLFVQTYSMVVPRYSYMLTYLFASLVRMLMNATARLGVPFLNYPFQNSISRAGNDV